MHQMRLHETHHRQVLVAVMKKLRLVLVFTVGWTIFMWAAVWTP
jgi:hypothetical protein